MKPLPFILIFSFTCFYVKCQSNLVPNPSFEEKTGCPNSNGQIELAVPWIGIGSVEYYHECGINGWTIPVNLAGYQYANSGQAYIGVGLRSIGSPGFREYAVAELTDTLITGKTYKVEFYVSMADSEWYATKSIGAYFSIAQPLANIDTLLSKEPQVKYLGTDFLDDKIDWTKIEGSFVAGGGEIFITIGNFDDNEHTDTLYVSGGAAPRPTQPFYWTHAYYFIDDVSVTLDTTTRVNELEKVNFEVYPNPANNNIFIETDLIEESIFQLFDISGRLILKQLLQSTKTSVNVSNLSQGVYVLVLEQEGKLPSRKKLIIE